MTEKDYLEQIQTFQTDPANEEPILARVKGRYMQALTDLYRLDNFSHERLRELLEKEVVEFKALMDYQEE